MFVHRQDAANPADCRIAARRRIDDNAPVLGFQNARGLFAGAVAATVMFAFSPLAAAQDAPGHSLAESAAESVRDAAASAWRTTQNLTSSALDLVGIRYRWGGTTPESGLDCSGLVQFVFQQVTGVTLPRSAKEMSRIGEKVGISDLKPGDLVFFNTRRFAYSHVGIYVGDSQFIHAPRRGREVEVATIDKAYWQKRFDGARRLVGVLPELMPALMSEAVASSLDVSAADSGATVVFPEAGGPEP
jgi:cell wall-associated NlpC family hydrolase